MGGLNGLLGGLGGILTNVANASGQQQAQSAYDTLGQLGNRVETRRSISWTNATREDTAYWRNRYDHYAQRRDVDYGPGLVTTLPYNMWLDREIHRRDAYVQTHRGGVTAQSPWQLAPKLTPNQLFHKLKKEREALVTKRLAERVERKEEGVVINKFLIGADPEFVALDGGGRVINGAVLGNGEIGYDHSGRVLELRPEPAKGAYALVKKIRRLLGDEKLRRLNAAKFRAGARVGTESLGGHIHFGVNPRDVAIGGGAVDALDAVTRVLEHLDILPKAECVNRRRGDYGHFGDVRTSHGKDGQPHLEYRTMASWLHDPKVAFLCLTAAKLAMCDPAGTLLNLKGATSFSKLMDWMHNYKSKDTNAARAYDKLGGNHKNVLVDPDADFRVRWEELGI